MRIMYRNLLDIILKNNTKKNKEDATTIMLALRLSSKCDSCMLRIIARCSYDDDPGTTQLQPEIVRISSWLPGGRRGCERERAIATSEFRGKAARGTSDY